MFQRMENPHVIVFGESCAPLAEVSALLPMDLTALCLSDPVELREILRCHNVTALIFVVPSTGTPELSELSHLASYLVRTPIILVSLEPHLSTEWLDTLMTYHPRALLTYPFEAARMEAVLAQADSRKLEASLDEANRRLSARSQEINTVYTVGKSVAASLDVDEILERVVVPAVNLTQADSGFVILKEGEQLFVYVVRHREEPTVELLHAPTSDQIAWQVIRSGRPAMLHREVRVATDLLVRSFLYVPLQTPGGEITGALGMVNWKKNEAFGESQLFAVSTIADFAAVALENAQLYKVREAERYRLSAILQHAAEVIILSDLDDRLWLWSDAAARLFEIPPSAQGQSLTQHIRSVELQEVFAQISTESPFYHAEVTLADGTVYNTQVSAVEGIGRMTVMQNITHLKELNRLKSEFVSTVSHDLRTPLTTVQGYLELLDRAGPLNEIQSQFVTTALTSLDHITDLISDLLDIGRIEAGYDLDMQPFRFDELIETTVEASQVAANAADVTLKIEELPSPIWVRGNSRRLRQVMENLISNAMKYNQKGGWVRIGVSQDDYHAIVSVSDSGIGIPHSEQTRIFDRFYRVQSPETEGIHGTGLGLSIVKSVVEKHKGRVWVKSTAGRGSTFCFVLPTSKAPAP
jgi:two-component system, OmpR family, phosphate regulon sensor histidine kinase PhoR